MAMTKYAKCPSCGLTEDVHVRGCVLDPLDQSPETVERRRLARLRMMYGGDITQAIIDEPKAVPFWEKADV